MNTESALVDRLAPDAPPIPLDEETLVEDARAAVRPAQRVDQKLVVALQSNAVCLSHLHALRRGRGGREVAAAPAGGLQP